MSSIHNFLLATLKKNELKRNFKNNVRGEIRIQQLNEVFLKKILNSDMPNRCEYIKQEESTYEGIFF